MSEIQDMVSIYRLGAEGSYFFVKGSVQLVLFLYQQYKKLQRADLLNAGEVGRFEQFVTATEGKFQLLNIPTEQTEELSEMKRDFEKLHICYTVLPDLAVGDGMTTIAYAIADTPQVENWYRRFCLSHLSGGELTYEKLQQYTEGQVSIVNIPWEADTLKTEAKVSDLEKDKSVSQILAETESQTKQKMADRTESLKKLREDFEKLHINFAILPDLAVGDGNIQVAYASADAPKLHVWYQNYQEELVGKPSDQLKEISLQEYMDLGKVDGKGYKALQPEAVKTVLEKTYDKKKTKPPEAVGSLSYQEAIRKPGAMVLPIPKEKVLQAEGAYIVNIPASKDYLLLGDLFLQPEGKTYTAVLNQNEEYPILNREGKLLEKRMGEEIYKHWEQEKAGLEVSMHLSSPRERLQKRVKK